jgi:Neocarzinostatin family
MSNVLNRTTMPKDGCDHPVTLAGRSGLPLRVIMLLCAAAALAMGCAPEQTTTGPSGSASLARTAATPTVAVHPSQNLDPDGRTVTVIGTGYPANVTVQLAECTGFPAKCLALLDVPTDEHGRFVARVFVAFDFALLSPNPPAPTCSEPTQTGDLCFLDATATTGASSASVPLTFAR